MTERKSEPAHQRPSDTVWLTAGVTWVALLVLLALNALLAFAPLGPGTMSLNFGVALLQVLLVGVFFMRLNRGSKLVRLTAAAGFFWLVFLFVFAGADYLTR